MKTLLRILITGMVLCCTTLCQAETLDTYHAGWQLVRETANEDGATFAAVYDLTGVGGHNGEFASKDTNSVANGGPFHIPARITTGGMGFKASQGSKWVFTICGKNYNDVDDTFSFNVVGWGKDNGMLQNLCEGDGVLGTQAVVTYPDGGDALGDLISVADANYTHATKTFTVTDGGFDGAVVGMLARVTGAGFTDEICNITTVTDVNTIVCDITTSSANVTDANCTVQINPSMWADTIAIDETTKWPRDNEPNNVSVYNSGDNEVCQLVIETAGLEWLQFIIYDADAATGEQAGAITVYGRPY